MIITEKKIPLYYGVLTIIFTDNFKEVFDKYDIKGDHEDCNGLSLIRFHKNKTRFIALYKLSPTHNTIAHEALHTTHRILYEIDATGDFQNDETECYLHGWIVEQIYKAAEKNSIKIII